MFLDTKEASFDTDLWGREVEEDELRDCLEACRADLPPSTSFSTAHFSFRQTHLIPLFRILLCT